MVSVKTKDGQHIDLGYVRPSGCVKKKIGEWFVYVIKTTEGDEIVFGQQEYKMLFGGRK